jgi:hypothetical protein
MAEVPAAAGPSDEKPPRFAALLAPSHAALEAVAQLAPEEPLRSPAVLRALAPPGARLVACGVWRGERLVAGLAGWESGRPFLRRLSFPALPAFADGTPAVADCLWTGLRGLARRRRAPWLELSSLLGELVPVPPVLGPLQRMRWRREPVADLAARRLGTAAWPAPPWRERLERAARDGVTVELDRSPGALAAHRALPPLGGAPPPGDQPPEVLRPGAGARLVEAGLASVIRASRGSEPLASLLVLDGARRACLLDARAAPGDAGLDAAALLARSAAEAAAARGAAELSLGGVTEEEPEAALRFRQAFAGTERHAVHLVTVAGPRAAERLHRAWTLLAGSPAALPRAAARRLAWRQRFTVHGWGPPEWRPAEPPAGVVLRRLPDDELVALSSRSDAIGTHRFYVQRHGINGAWGLFVDGELAHVTWIYTRAMHDREPYAGLRLADDEAELGNCVTLPRFKGRGLYPLAIRLLSRRLFDEGVRRVLMVTARGNAASERGIAKAGLARVGRLSYLWLPPLGRLRIGRRVPGMAPAVEWVDLQRAFRAAAAPGPAQGG